MKRFLTVFLMLGLSFCLFAGSGVTVIGRKSSSPENKKLIKGADVKVILKGDKFFYADKYLGEKGSNYLFLEEGQKVMLPKSIVKEIKLHMALKGESTKREKIIQKFKERREAKRNKRKLVLTDYNVERHYIGNENMLPKEANKESQKASGMRVKVENQVIERKKDTITFKASIKNVTGLEVGKLSIILNIYDNKGKLVEKKKVFLANSLKDGKSIPFTYSLKDPEGKITRFDYSFEGIVYKPVKKEE